MNTSFRTKKPKKQSDSDSTQQSPSLVISRKEDPQSFVGNIMNKITSNSIEDS